MSISTSNTECSHHCSSDYFPSDDSEEGCLTNAPSPPKQLYSREDSRKEGLLQGHIRKNYNLYIILIISLLACLLCLQIMSHYIILCKQGFVFQRNNGLLELLPTANIPLTNTPSSGSLNNERVLKVEAEENKANAAESFKPQRLRSYGRHEQSEFTPPLIIEKSTPQSTQTQTKLNINKEDDGSFDSLTNQDTKGFAYDLKPLQESQRKDVVDQHDQERNSKPAQTIQNELFSNLQNPFFESPIQVADSQQSIFTSNIAPQFPQNTQFTQNSIFSNLQPLEISGSDDSTEDSEQTGDGVFEISNDYTGITLQQRDQALNWLALKDLDISKTNSFADEERNYYEAKYQVSTYPEKSFCLVVPSYNNAEQSRHLKNMQSILMQEYKNFHIVFIDDASQDSTGDDVENLLATQTVVDRDRWVVIRNKQQKLAMANLRNAALNYCRAQDIFMIVDGDDQLVGRQVLKLFNAVFTKENVWFMYTNFVTPRGNVGFSRPIPPEVMDTNAYRRHPFVTSHLRAFYTQLFRNIKQSDLRDEQGEYFRAANDVAICLPILEQAQNRVIYVAELTYYYNSNTGINNHMLRLSEQKRNDVKLRSRIPYKRVQGLFPSVPSS